MLQSLNDASSRDITVNYLMLNNTKNAFTENVSPVNTDALVRHLLRPQVTNCFRVLAIISSYVSGKWSPQKFQMKLFSVIHNISWNFIKVFIKDCSSQFVLNSIIQNVCQLLERILCCAIYVNPIY